MFGKNAKVDLELNRDVEQLIKTGGKEKILPTSRPSSRSRARSVRLPPLWPARSLAPSWKIKIVIKRYMLRRKALLRHQLQDFTLHLTS